MMVPLFMDVSIKGLEAGVVARLAEQAAVEGVSAQEWMREALGRRAAVLTPRELEAAVKARKTVSRERHDATMAVVNGVGDLISSLCVGWLWAALGPSVGFGYAVVLMAAGAALVFVTRNHAFGAVEQTP